MPNIVHLSLPLQNTTFRLSDVVEYLTHLLHLHSSAKQQKRLMLLQYPPSKSTQRSWHWFAGNLPKTNHCSMCTIHFNAWLSIRQNSTLSDNYIAPSPLIVLWQPKNNLNCRCKECFEVNPCIQMLTYEHGKANSEKSNMWYTILSSVLYGPKWLCIKDVHLKVGENFTFSHYTFMSLR